MLPVLLFLLVACGSAEVVRQSAFFDKQGRHVGDSIYINDCVRKIILVDSTYFIDSIVFERIDGDGKKIKSVRTFRAGREVFENIDYYENGKVKKYRFVDEDEPLYFYERVYDTEGRVISAKGRPFFQGFINNNTNSDTVKVGTDISYKIYFPNPPDCKSELYVEQDDGKLYSVFKQNPFIGFLRTTTHRTSSTGVFETAIQLHLNGAASDTVAVSRSSYIFTVVL